MAAAMRDTRYDRSKKGKARSRRRDKAREGTAARKKWKAAYMRRYRRRKKNA